MKPSSYIISVSEGPGVYRHIRIASGATLKALHEAILAAYKIEHASQPFFLPQRRVWGEHPLKYGTNSTKTTVAMRNVTLEGAGFGGKGTLSYTLARPRVHFNCRTLRVLEEETPEPQVVRASGLNYDFKIAMSRLIQILVKNEMRQKDSAAMAEDDKIPDEAWEIMADYYLAAGNLYGIVPLKIVYDLYLRHRQPVSFVNFKIFCLVLSRREKPRFYLLDSRGKKLGRDDDDGREAEFIADYTVVENEAFEHVRSLQKDKPYYLPPEREFLRYADEEYAEETTQYLALKTHLLSLGLDPRKAKKCMLDLIDCVRFSAGDAQEFYDVLEQYKIRLKNLTAANHALNLFSQLNNNTRTHINCGHTPEEIIALTREKSGGKTRRILVPKFGPGPHLEVDDWEEEDPSLPMGEILPIPLPRQVEQKPGRNAPCPCGSGKKYKHCCGKPGAE